MMTSRSLLDAPPSSLKRLASASEMPDPLRLNDLHSRLNPTRVGGVLRPDTVSQLRAALSRAREENRPISLSGGRHAMGGQQFRTGAMHLDLRGLNRVLSFDPAGRRLEVEAGIEWPELIAFTTRAQEGRATQVGIAQKQTGADRLSLGGSLSANIHGRGLRMKPFISDIESFILLDAAGELHRCSRTENGELFRLAIGGYGLFGIIVSVVLRLVPRRKLERVVTLADLDDLPNLFASRLADGYLYGDFQYMTDPRADGFLRRGVFSCYRPVHPATPPGGGSELTADDWRELLFLAHTDRRRAFDLYAKHYLSTHGQIYWSDAHQLSLYLDDYHREIDRRLKAPAPASEMITEIYVPRARLVEFMRETRADFSLRGTELIYGTIRLIERDDESFLAWAKEPFACIIFNLHVEHSPSGKEKARADFLRLIDRAINYGGSFYLTYHRWATRRQVEACYPQFAEFLQLKRQYDPTEIFQSDWYGHYRQLFTGAAERPTDIESVVYGGL